MLMPLRRTPRRQRRSGLLTTMLAATLCVGVLNGAPGPAGVTAPARAGPPTAAAAATAAIVAAATTKATTWTPVWRDDFAGTVGALPSPGTWVLDTGRSYPGGPDHWGTGEQETYTADPANISLDGQGRLRLTATRNSAGAWSSARIETRRADLQPPAGGQLRVEVRVQLPAGGPGYWPAVWMLGAPYRVNNRVWPATGEIDLLENINNQPSVHGTLHCGTVEVGGPCAEDSGLTGAYTLPQAAGSAGFHTYSLVWTDRPGRLDWYVDGLKYWSVAATTPGANTWAAAMSHGYFLLFDLAVGGGWPGAPAAGTRSGQSMLIDYVAVSRASGSGS